jgi:phasin family protein
MALTAPVNHQKNIYDTGGDTMNSHIEDLKNVTRAELEKRLIESTHVTNSALSIVSDLIHLNMDNIQKSIQGSNEAMRELLHASDAQSFVSNLTSQQANARERATEYAKNLSSIALHARKHSVETINTSMTYLAEKMQHFVDQINSTDPTWLNYQEHFKTSLANAQSAYVDLTKKTYGLQETYQKSWPGTNESNEKSSSKKSKKS